MAGELCAENNEDKDRVLYQVLGSMDNTQTIVDEGCEDYLQRAFRFFHMR